MGESGKAGTAEFMISLQHFEMACIDTIPVGGFVGLGLCLHDDGLITWRFREQITVAAANLAMLCIGYSGAVAHSAHVKYLDCLGYSKLL